MSYYYGYYEEEVETDAEGLAVEEVEEEEQNIFFLIQPVAAVLGVGYGTWSFISVYNKATTKDTGLLLGSIFGWASALGTALWFVMPNTIYGPALGAALNLVGAVWPWIDDGYTSLGFSGYWFMPVLGAAAVAVDALVILAVLGEASDEDMEEDYGEEDGEEDGEEACDPYYDYYCY